jgi:hypothetical protein
VAEWGERREPRDRHDWIGRAGILGLNVRRSRGISRYGGRCRRRTHAAECSKRAHIRARPLSAARGGHTGRTAVALRTSRAGNRRRGGPQEPQPDHQHHQQATLHEFELQLRPCSKCPGTSTNKRPVLRFSHFPTPRQLTPVAEATAMCLDTIIASGVVKIQTRARYPRSTFVAKPVWQSASCLESIFLRRNACGPGSCMRRASVISAMSAF